ncbi:glycosyltransferase family 2 protein [Enterococcus dongliensis]|uniref:glycosyltransferase family 2 protein n=1 Tax=Enterococcus dongliensis TaxID=2559925 RepID=UPI00288CCE35|nr:glycosyltransferase [Enterococcus dongliensis]MDT2612646.1 glycosyltransferase [Enterococcus dongliensis]
MTNVEKFSLIIPVYNAGDRLRTMLTSLSAQTYKQFEVLIVDNNSTDHSIAIAKEFIDKLPVLTILSESKQGSAAARNLGIERATSEWLFFLDADDQVENTFLEEFAKVIDKTVEVAICGYNRIEYGTKQIVMSFKNDGLEELNPQATIQVGKFPSYHAYLWNKCFRKSIIEKFRIRFHEELIVAQDWPFHMEYFTKIQSVKLINKILYHYYIYDKSASRNRLSPGFREKDLLRDRAFQYCVEATDNFDKKTNLYFKNLQIVNRMRLLKDMKRTDYAEFRFYLNKWRNNQTKAFLDIFRDAEMSFNDKVLTYCSGLIFIWSGIDLKRSSKGYKFFERC